MDRFVPILLFTVFFLWLANCRTRNTVENFTERRRGLITGARSQDKTTNFRVFHGNSDPNLAIVQEAMRALLDDVEIDMILGKFTTTTCPEYVHYLPKQLIFRYFEPHRLARMTTQDRLLAIKSILPFMPTETPYFVLTDRLMRLAALEKALSKYYSAAAIKNLLNQVPAERIVCLLTKLPHSVLDSIERRVRVYLNSRTRVPENVPGDLVASITPQETTAIIVSMIQHWPYDVVRQLTCRVNNVAGHRVLDVVHMPAKVDNFWMGR